MSAAKLYRVRWERSTRRGVETQSRVYRQRIAAVRLLLTMIAEGHSAVMDSAPMPAWQREVVSSAEAKAQAPVVARRVHHRQVARERWAES